MNKFSFSLLGEKVLNCLESLQLPQQWGLRLPHCHVIIPFAFCARTT